MLLQTFLTNFEESRAQRAVADYLKEEADGSARAEFMGHFLNTAFQPVFELRSQQLHTVGFEAYLRPAAGNKDIPPAHYFRNLKAEDQSFTDRLCRELHVTNFLKQAKPQETLSLNISRETLIDHQHQIEQLAFEIKNLHILDCPNTLQPYQLTIEINMATDVDAGLIFAFTNQLRSIGVGMALEGFDADGASFSRIVQNRPDVVKFNRSWLDADILDSRYINLVASTVTAIRAISAKAHLEYIETSQELAFAIACGFDRYQGYQLGTPSSALQRDRITPNF